MMQAIKSEWMRLTSRKMILGGGGAMVGLGVLATVMVFSLVQHEEGGGRGPGVPGALLEQPDGFVQSFAFTGQVLGGTSLVLFARTITNEYRNGTLKAMLAREPRRLVFLSAKFLAMAMLVSAALLAAFLVAGVAAHVVATARGIETGEWWTATGVAETVLGFLRLLVATAVWGLFGFALGTVFRSGGTAIGIGIGVLAIGGHLLEMFWDDASRWLPDLVLAVFTVGGSADVSLEWAALLVGAYTGVLCFVATFAFTRGDVKG